jgi:hypothetical protein
MSDGFWIVELCGRPHAWERARGIAGLECSGRAEIQRRIAGGFSRLHFYESFDRLSEVRRSDAHSKPRGAAELLSDVSPEASLHSILLMREPIKCRLSGHPLPVGSSSDTPQHFDGPGGRDRGPDIEKNQS